MVNNQIKLKQLLVKENINFLENEPLKNFTTFKIGGRADIIVMPKNIHEVSLLMNHVVENEIPHFVLGNGSNILCSDNNFHGVVIQIGENLADIQLIAENTVVAQGGTLLKNLCTFAAENSLTGMEELYGIPGSVGGALYMNAGAYGGEIKNIAEASQHINLNGNIGGFQRGELDLSYRHSVYKDNRFIITALTVKLEKGDKKEIKARMDDYMNKRITKQPLEYPSGGSTFKRPVGGYASAIIDDCGLKGLTVGGASVSKKHAGFVINKNNATSSDVKNLIELVKKTVKEKKDICLECEIVIIE